MRRGREGTESGVQEIKVHVVQTRVSESRASGVALVVSSC